MKYRLLEQSITEAIDQYNLHAPQCLISMQQKEAGNDEYINDQDNTYASILQDWATLYTTMAQVSDTLLSASVPLALSDLDCSQISGAKGDCVTDCFGSFFLLHTLEQHECNIFIHSAEKLRQMHLTLSQYIKSFNNMLNDSAYAVLDPKQIKIFSAKHGPQALDLINRWYHVLAPHIDQVIQWHYLHQRYLRNIDQKSCNHFTNQWYVDGVWISLQKIIASRTRLFTLLESLVDSLQLIQCRSVAQRSNLTDTIAAWQMSIIQPSQYAYFCAQYYQRMRSIPGFNMHSKKMQRPILAGLIDADWLQQDHRAWKASMKVLTQMNQGQILMNQSANADDDQLLDDVNWLIELSHIAHAYPSLQGFNHTTNAVLKQFRADLIQISQGACKVNYNKDALYNEIINFWEQLKPHLLSLCADIMQKGAQLTFYDLNQNTLKNCAYDHLRRQLWGIESGDLDSDLQRLRCLNQKSSPMTAYSQVKLLHTLFGYEGLTYQEVALPQSGPRLCQQILANFEDLDLYYHKLVSLLHHDGLISISLCSDAQPKERITLGLLLLLTDLQQTQSFDAINWIDYLIKQYKIYGLWLPTHEIDHCKQVLDSSRYSVNQTMHVLITMLRSDKSDTVLQHNIISNTQVENTIGHWWQHAGVATSYAHRRINDINHYISLCRDRLTAVSPRLKTLQYSIIFCSQIAFCVMVCCIYMILSHLVAVCCIALWLMSFVLFEPIALFGNRVKQDIQQIFKTIFNKKALQIQKGVF